MAMIKTMVEWRDCLVTLLAKNGAMTAKAIAKAFTDMGYGDISTQKVIAIIKSFPDGVIKVYKVKDSKKLCWKISYSI